MTTPPQIPDPVTYGVLQGQPGNKNPLLKSRFQFRTRKIPNTTYFCQSANVPGVSITNVEQQTIFNPVARPGGVVVHEPLKLQFLIDEEMVNWREIFTWIRECSDYVDFAEYKGPEKHLISDATLMILDSNQIPKFRVTFDGIFPTKLSSVEFAATVREAENIFADVTFAFTSFKIENIYSSVSNG